MLFLFLGSWVKGHFYLHTEIFGKVKDVGYFQGLRERGAFGRINTGVKGFRFNIVI